MSKSMRWTRGACAALWLGSLLSPSQASDYGCKVLLCLANPNGPRAVDECRPPIDRLFRDLARGRSFPSCDMASGPNGSARARRTYAYFDPCPSGTSALPSGSFVVVGQALRQGIGEGENYQPYDPEYAPVGPTSKVCVGTKVADVMHYSPEDYSMTPAATYDPVVLLDPASSPRAIDVFINDALWRRVRY